MCRRRLLLAEGRPKLILISVAVAESVWLFALFSMVGLIGDMGGSPLPWISLLVLLLISITTGYVLGATEGDEVSIAIRQSLFGLVVIYFVLATGTFLGDRSFDLGWIFRLVAGDLGSTAAFSAIFGLFISIWLWRHGLRLGTDRYPEDRLARIFKIGIGVLAVATVIDQASDEDLNASVLLLPFFAATLTGLAIGRLPEGGVGKKTGEWARIIGLSVFGIMGVGLLIGLLGGLYGNGGVRLLFAGWGLVVDGVLWVLRFPITWAAAVLQWFFGLFTGGPREEDERLNPGQSGEEIFGPQLERSADAGNATVDSILNILQYPVIALLIILAFFLLAMAFRRFGARGSSDDDDDRESIRDELDTSGDMSRLLGGLMPSWMRRKKGEDWRYPEDPGLAEVFKLYFESLRLGVKWGMEFQPQMTPAERLPMLQAALPGAPVAEVTDRFNAACYGKIATDQRTIEDLRERVKAAEKDLKNR